MDSKLRKMAILASMAVILLVALLVMYVNREQFTAPLLQSIQKLFRILRMRPVVKGQRDLFRFS